MEINDECIKKCDEFQFKHVVMSSLDKNLFSYCNVYAPCHVIVISIAEFVLRLVNIVWFHYGLPGERRPEYLSDHHVILEYVKGFNVSANSVQYNNMISFLSSIFDNAHNNLLLGEFLLQRVNGVPSNVSNMKSLLYIIAEIREYVRVVKNVLFFFFLLCLYCGCSIYRNGHQVELDHVSHVSMCFNMIKLFVQPSIHSGLVSITRILINADKRVIKSYNMKNLVASQRLIKLRNQFNMKKLLPYIPDDPSFVLILSNSFRMGIPIGYSRLVRLSEGALMTRCSIFTYRNIFAFVNNSDLSNVYLSFVYDNLCSRLYNSWLSKVYGVSLTMSTQVLNPWDVMHYVVADSVVADKIELINLHAAAGINSVCISSKAEVIKRQILLLQNQLEILEMKEVCEPKLLSSVDLAGDCVIDLDMDQVSYSDDETLNLHPLNGIAVFDGVFVLSPQIVSADLEHGEYLISRLLCYVHCKDSRWRDHYLVSYWNDMHISTYERRDDVPGGCQEYFWKKQVSSFVKTEMLQYLDGRRKREFKQYTKRIKVACKNSGGPVAKYLRNVNIREFEHPESHRMGIRNLWVKMTIVPDYDKNILEFELQWQDRAMFRYAEVQRNRQRSLFGGFVECYNSEDYFSVFLENTVSVTCVGRSKVVEKIPAGVTFVIIVLGKYPVIYTCDKNADNGLSSALFMVI